MPAQTTRFVGETFRVFRPAGYPDRLDDIASDYGDLLNVTQVQLRPNVQTYLCQHDEIAPHTDHFAADTIMWICHHQDAYDGSIILRDGLRALDILSYDEREILQKIELRCRPLTGNGALQSHPVLTEPGGKLFFAPWLPLVEDVPIYRHVLHTFHSALMDEQTIVASVRLEAGQALLINNKRLTHSRAQISTDSPRHLTRYWIRT